MPQVLSKKLKYKSRIFEIYDLKLQFDNGVKVDYEILYKDTVWTSMIVPIDQEGNVYFIREYFAAIDEYQICLPKGGVNYTSDKENRTAIEAANEELQEEIGMKAGKLISLGKFTNSPGSINKASEIFLATELIISKIQGDEPEELQVVKYPLKDFEKLIDNGELTEARAIAGLFLAKRYFKKYATAI